MTINPKDDYNTLGSLFYPSIEASGNVYYGQTRKLAIDELFNTNDGGFSQCVLSRPLNSDEKYFSWELGPLKGCLKVFNDFYDSDNIYFAKYNIKVKNNEPVVYDVIDSGQFPTYSKSVYVELDKDQPYIIGAVNPVTINDPEKAEAWDGRNFYVDVDKKILYIAIAKDSLKKEITKAMTYPSQEELEQPLTFENTGTRDTYIRLYKSSATPEANTNSYEYRTISKDGTINKWKSQSNYDQSSEGDVYSAFDGLADTVLDVDGSIRLKPGCKVQYRLIGEYSQITSLSANTRFMTVQPATDKLGMPLTDDPNLSLSGNIASMIAQKPELFSTIKDSSSYLFCHSEMFKNCYYIRSAKDLIIPYEIVCDEIAHLFSNCQSLLYAPYIYVKNIVMGKDLYGTTRSSGLIYLFSQCRSLLEPPPILPIVDYISGDVMYAYTRMFYMCSSIRKAPLMPLIRCTADALESMFYECSLLTQMPVLLIKKLDNIDYEDNNVPFNNNKALQNALIDTKIDAIYCAAVLDSDPSSKPKFSEWLPNSVQKIYVPSNYPDNFWESVDDANYREKITKIDTVMDANEYPQYWIKNESEDLLLVDGLRLTKDSLGSPMVLSTGHLSLTTKEKDAGIAFNVGSRTPLVISDSDIFIAGNVHIDDHIEECRSLTSDDIYCDNLEVTTICIDDENYSSYISKIPFDDDVGQNICMYSRQYIDADSTSIGFVATGSDYDDRTGEFSLLSAIGSHLAAEEARSSVFDEDNNWGGLGCAVICKSEGNYEREECNSSIALIAGDPSNSIKLSTENGIQIKSDEIAIESNKLDLDKINRVSYPKGTDLLNSMLFSERNVRLTTSDLLRLNYPHDFTFNNVPYEVKSVSKSTNSYTFNGSLELQLVENASDQYGDHAALFPSRLVFHNLLITQESTVYSIRATSTSTLEYTVKPFELASHNPMMYGDFALNIQLGTAVSSTRPSDVKFAVNASYIDVFYSSDYLDRLNTPLSSDYNRRGFSKYGVSDTIEANSTSGVVGILNLISGRYIPIKILAQALRLPSANTNLLSLYNLGTDCALEDDLPPEFQYGRINTIYTRGLDASQCIKTAQINADKASILDLEVDRNIKLSSGAKHSLLSSIVGIFDTTEPADSDDYRLLYAELYDSELVSASNGYTLDESIDDGQVYVTYYEDGGTTSGYYNVYFLDGRSPRGSWEIIAKTQFEIDNADYSGYPSGSTRRVYIIAQRVF